MTENKKPEKLPLRTIWFNLSRYVGDGQLEPDVARDMMRGSVEEEIGTLIRAYEPRNFGQLLAYLRTELGGMKGEHAFSDVELRRMIAKAHAERCRTTAFNALPGSALHADLSNGGIFDEEALESNLRAMEKTVAGWKGKPPIRFGVSLLDDAFGGLLPGEICTLVGSPGSMKTSLGISAVEKFVRDAGGMALYVSVDMPPEEISLRLVLRECFDQYGDFELKAMMARNDPAYLSAKKAMLDKYSGHLAITGHRLRRRMSLDRMLEEAAIRMPDLLVVDYLTALKDIGEDDLKLVERAMPTIQAFAQECQIPVLLLSQMSRGSRSEQSVGKIGGHAKGGGIVEELSTIEIELMREPSTEGRKPEIVATIVKTRRGVAGQSFFLDYVGQSMRFTGVAHRAQRPNGKKPVFERVFEDYGGAS